MALKNIFFLFLAFLFVGCEEEVDQSNSSDLQNTLNQNDLGGKEGSADDYFFQLEKKLDIAYHVAQQLVVKAQNKGIDPHKLQQKWTILSPTLLRLVSEYTPKKQKHLGD